MMEFMGNILNNKTKHKQNGQYRLSYNCPTMKPSLIDFLENLISNKL